MILVSVMPIGLPVVTGAVLAVGAREMVKEKAIVSRWVAAPCVAQEGGGGWELKW